MLFHSSLRLCCPQSFFPLITSLDLSLSSLIISSAVSNLLTAEEIINVIQFSCTFLGLEILFGSFHSF